MTRISRDAYGLRLAEAAASRADCTRRQVGAVIVAEDGSVVATGYNGLASGLPGCASAGACPRGQMAYPTEPPVKVGDADVTATNVRLTEECPAKKDDGRVHWRCTLPPEHTGWHIAGNGRRVCAVWPVAHTHPASTGYEATGCRAVHAEVNAIIRAGRERCIGATIYVTDEPCFHCSVVIEGAGIARVVRPAPSGDSYFVRQVAVPATAPPPSGVAGAPTPTSGVCDCEGPMTQTVHQSNAEGHQVGCPRWGIPQSPSNGAPTYATGGYVGPVDGGWIRDTLRAASDRAHALPAYARPTVTRPVFNGGQTDADLPGMWERADFLGGATDVVRTSGPLDPEIHAALVRSVERGRR